MSTLSKILILFISINQAFGQFENLKGYFQFPINPGKNSSLAGTFAELRGNHFHSGIDIRTNEKENLEVVSSAEGYVSRINVSTSGFGKALYIQHPNGLTTVYAHLNRFSPEIEAYVRAKQYENKKFQIKLFPKKDELKVKKGQLIALSGNTGGSKGPHLHFEVRNNKSEPINPLYAEFPELQDTIKPLIRSLTFSPITRNASVGGSTEPSFIRFNPKSNIAFNSAIPTQGKIGFGIEVYDNNNGANNQNGIHIIEVYENDKLIFTHMIDKFYHKFTEMSKRAPLNWSKIDKRGGGGFRLKKK